MFHCQRIPRLIRIDNLLLNKEYTCTVQHMAHLDIILIS